MNISRSEQRVLHVLAQGGHIRHQRADNGRITDILCFTRDGHVLADCTLEVFAKLRRKRLIESRASSPYRISDKGRRSVRAQLDNR
ncbi:MAG: YjhX family toxin [Pseudomonadota bacterium]